MWVWSMEFKPNTGSPTALIQVTVANGIGMKELEYCERITKLIRQEVSTLLEQRLQTRSAGDSQSVDTTSAEHKEAKLAGRQPATPAPAGWARGKTLSGQISPGGVLHHRLPSVISNPLRRVFEIQGKLK